MVLGTKGSVCMLIGLCFIMQLEKYRICLLVSNLFTSIGFVYQSVLESYVNIIFYFPLRKRLSIRSVISVNYNYINVLCPFNLLIRFKCYSTV